MRFFLYLLLMISFLQARIPIPKDLFYLNELPLAQKRAEKLDLPIAFIVSLPAFLDLEEEQTDALSPHPAGATHYAFQAFQEKAVLVWINADLDQKEIPPMVEQSLYETNISFFYPPKVVITTPHLDRVIATISMTDNIEERQRWSLTALDRMEDKTSWKSPLPSSTSLAESNPEKRSIPFKTPSWIFFALGLILGGILTYSLILTRK